MIKLLMQLFSFLIVVGIIVLAHESGHFFAARLMKIRVEVFSFGIGRRLFGWKRGQTDFRVSLIPLGGYVRLGGEEEFDSDRIKPDDFYAKNRGQRFFTMVMGSVMNMILAFAILVVINLTGVEKPAYESWQPEIGYIAKDSPAASAGLSEGDLLLAINGQRVLTWRDVDLIIGSSPSEILEIEYRREGELKKTRLQVRARKEYSVGYAGFYWVQPAVIDRIDKGYPAYKAGLKKGDRIIAVNGKPVGTYFKVREMILDSPQEKMEFLVLRENTEKTLAFTPIKGENGKGVAGFQVKYDFIKIRYGFFASLREGFKESVRLLTLTVKVFQKIIRRTIPLRSMSGPMEIGEVAHQALEMGLSNFFLLIAFISLQLGLINLFPIPGLDGGHLLILSVETVFRRDLNMKLKTALLYAGFLMLIALMIFVILNDVAKKLPNGWSSLLPF